ncbi:MAG: O-antigen ligase family protein [Candidatus Sulfotelmatobacter sp.]
MTTAMLPRPATYRSTFVDQPSLTSSVLFVLLFSGPPKFRERDTAASLRGDIDAVVILHVLVSIATVLWVFYQMRFYFQPRSKPIGVWLPQKLGLALVAALGLSAFVSVSPALTAFMVWKIFGSLIFTMAFVGRYGVDACLKKLFQASAVICIAIPFVLLINSDLVLVTTETGALRLRGDYFVGTETVAVLCLVLLFSGVQKLSKVTYGFLTVLCLGLLVASLSRTAGVILFVVSLLAVFKRLPSKAFARLATVMGAFVASAGALNIGSFLEKYRDPESVFTLSDRTGLWAYLSRVTLAKSPFIGLGYYAASRVYAVNYNSGLGTAHSMFFEAFVGGGLIGITILVALCVVMSVYAVRTFFRGNTNLSFLLSTLFLVCLMFGAVGPNIDSGPIAITFWSLAAILPLFQHSRQAVAPRKRASTDGPRASGFQITR